MRTALEPAPPVPEADPRQVSPVRLHGEACWFCGAVHSALRPVGSVATAVEGGWRVWTVVGCADHVHLAVR